jgi:glycosyltransferase involved in cell wall biosynthesis
MHQTVFYGFQYPHHGEHSAFLALSRELNKSGIHICNARYPVVSHWVPEKWQDFIFSKWFQFSERKIKKALAAGNTVHYFFPENSLYKAHLWRRNKARIIISCHQPINVLKKLNTHNWLEHFFTGLRNANDIVLMASHEIDTYQKLAPHSNITCIPHGVDCDFFSPPPTPPSQKDPFKILTVGDWLRDYALWREVASKITAINPKIAFTIVANKTTTKRLTSNLSNINLRTLANIPDTALLNEYRTSNLLFLPLLDAYANNALLEAMSCGLPALVTDLPATREYAADAACYFEKNSADDAIKKIRHLYNNPDLTKSLALQGRNRVKSLFSWRTISQKYLALYANESKY